MKRVTICVLLFGDNFKLAKKCINSIVKILPIDTYELRVGVNECCDDTITHVNKVKQVDKIYKEKKNINKYSLMTKMFKDIDTEFIWWFDDDCFIRDEIAIKKRLELMDSNEDKKTVVLGHTYFFGAKKNWRSFKPSVNEWCKKQVWYEGKKEPSGRYEYQEDYYKYDERRFYFPTGYSWFARTDFIKEIEYPKGIHGAGDVAMSFAIRQKGYRFQDVKGVGMGIMKVPSRKNKKINRKQNIIINKEFGKSGQHGFRSNADFDSMKYLIDKYNIKSIVDIGCGLGEQIEMAIGAGIKGTGIDGDTHTIECLKQDDFIVHDYTQGQLIIEPHDLAWSVEFVEHVKEKYVPNFLKTFQCCEMALITYAPPGQGGNHHVNVQKEEYWIKVFDEYGFKYNEEETLKIRGVATNKWIIKKALFFEKKLK